jgi:hypothetical protein
MENKRGLGFMVIVFIVISVIVTLGMFMLLLDGGPLQTAKGGCFINFGEGCNVTVHQSITQQPDILTSPLFIIALSTVIFLGIGFLIATRGNGNRDLQK